MKLKTLVLEDGERFPILIEKETNTPYYWTTLYTSILLRKYTQNTIANTLRDIDHFLIWETSNNRNLISEFHEGKLLTLEDIHSIRDHCSFSTKRIKHVQKSNISQNKTKISLLHPTPLLTTERIQLNTLNIRLSRVASFLEFLAYTVLRESPNLISLKPQITEMKKRILSQKAKGIDSSSQKRIPSTPPKQVFEKLMSVIALDSPINPWKNEEIKFRNWLMIKLLYETGIRAGEVLSLRIDYLNLYDEKPSIRITRNHNDIHDSRPYQPVAKTLERNIPISFELVEAIDRYIKKRSLIPNANKHPYLFVTHHKGHHLGRPLSEAAFYGRVFKPIVEKMPNLFEGVTRHTIRHNFNERLSERFDLINSQARDDSTINAINEKQESQIRMQLCGWKSEETASIYNLRHIEKRAREALLKDMNAQSGRNNEPEYES